MPPGHAKAMLNFGFGSVLERNNPHVLKDSLHSFRQAIQLTSEGTPVSGSALVLVVRLGVFEL